jgi:hypothetical protein
MPKVKVEIVEGWEGPLEFQLLSDGSAQNLTSVTVTGRAYDRDRSLVNLTGDVAVSSATGGIVALSPDSGDFYASGSPYELRFKATDGAGGVVFYPSGEAITLIVRP